MAKIAFLDTHVVAWLYAGETGRFPVPVISCLEICELKICPAVVLELQYLHEIKRLRVGGREIMQALEKEIGIGFPDIAFDRVIQEAVRHSWTRDPFDRMIVATAAIKDSLLITKDELIRKHYKHAIWD